MNTHPSIYFHTKLRGACKFFMRNFPALYIYIYIYIITQLRVSRHLSFSISSTEKDIDTRLTKAWIAVDRLSIIWK